MRHVGVIAGVVGVVAAWSMAAAQQQHHHMHGSGPGAGAPPAATADAQEFVQLPAPMQEHMLANMRDHLATLSEITGDLADGKLDAAAKLAEQRLGMSSLSLHDAAHMAPFMPQPMQDIGTSMHRAASRLALTIQDADVAPSVEAMAKVNRGLHELTSACVACHAGYRVR
ncbi:MAG: hypothetical protein JSR72_21000 [Proteobacteria bacterium]|nr:hypothetical protein [Pseudomonadota bacterium]